MKKNFFNFENISKKKNKDMSDNTKDTSLFLRNISSSYVSKEVRFIPKNKMLISNYKNKNVFSNYLSSFFFILNHPVSYKGTWLKFNVNNGNRNKQWYNNHVKNFFFQHESKNYSLYKSIQKYEKSIKAPYNYIAYNFNSYNLWNRVLKSTSIDSHTMNYDLREESVNIDTVFWKNHFPYCISIDSEYVDKIITNTVPFENKRERYPVSITIDMKNIANGQSKLLHCLFNKEYKDILMPYKKDDIMELVEYKTNVPINLDNFNKDPLLLEEKSPFLITLHKIMLNLFPNLNIDQTELFLCPSQYINNKKIFINPYILTIFFFFSVKDLRYFFGNTCYLYIEQFLVSRRIVTFQNYKNKSPFGFIYRSSEFNINIKIQILDISGLCDRGLSDLADLTDVKLKFKEDLNKEDITVSLKEYPEKYLNYCREDTQYLTLMACQSWCNYIELYEHFNIPKIPYFVNFSSSLGSKGMRFTTGSNISTFFESYIYSLHPSVKHTLNCLSIRVGDDNSIDGINMGSSRYINYLGGHAKIAAFVSGGRCCNERPLEMNFDIGADIDLASCYGNSIKNLVYPIGIPFVLRPLIDQSIDSNNQPSFFEPYVGTLGNVLKSYRKYLVPGTWEAIVSTKEPLSFSFDLLVSKNITIKNDYEENKNVDSNNTVPGEQFVLNKEVKNAILVQSTLEVIDKIASRNEKKELYDKLWVKVMIYYDKRYQCHSLEEFNRKISLYYHNKQNLKKTKGRPRLNKDTVGIGSKKEKPMFWYGVHMEPFVEQLISKRKYLQKLFKETNDSMFNSKQRNFKLAINMIYGVTASKYFNVSNLCFANNITGLAKTSVWIMAKSLNSCQCITDGGIYQLNKVNHWNLLSNKRKPNFNELSINALEQNRKNIIKPLGYTLNHVFNWNLKINEAINNLTKQKELTTLCDRLAFEHIHSFINYFKMDYKIVFPYNIEHKTDNFFTKATTLNRGHYYLININNQEIKKIRGVQQKIENDTILSPVFDALYGKIYYQDVPINNLAFTKKTLVKSKDLNKLNKEYNDIHLHDTFVAKTCFKIKLDCGKFNYYSSFKSITQKSREKDHYLFLNNSYFIYNNNQWVLLKEYWKVYHEQVKSSCFPIKDTIQFKRFSKNTCKETLDLLKKAVKCDPLFYNEYLEKLSKKSNKNTISIFNDDNNYNDNDDNNYEDEDIPLLSDNAEENEFIDNLYS